MRKKIMLIHHSGSIGGAGVSAYNTILSLKDEYEVVIYCPSNPRDFSNYLEEKGVNVKTYDFHIGSVPYYSGGPSILSPWFIKALLDISISKKKWLGIIKKENPDLVIVNSKILAWTSVIFKNINQKSICYVRETRKKSFFNLWNNIQKSFLDNFDGVIFISRYDQDIESLKNARTETVPNFINIDSYNTKRTKGEACEKFGLDSSTFNILFVGGMLRIKGFDVAIKSMKYLKGLNVKLIVAGDAKFIYDHKGSIYSKFYNIFKRKYENSIKREIVKNNLERNIIKIGIQKDMMDVYALADVLIFPATKPHQARPLFEAGAMKVPVVMPNFENTLEYICDGDNGLIFKRNNPRSLAENIRMLINDEKFRKTLGERNYDYTLMYHTKETSEKLLKDMIDNLFINKH